MNIPNLPKCPCGSGWLYEECCYKKMGPDGKPLFFKGGVIFTTKNKYPNFPKKLNKENIHPIPNFRPLISVSIRIDSESRKFTSEILKNVKIDDRNRKKLTNSLAIFHESYIKIIKEITKGGGLGISQIDSSSTRLFWRDFLFNGRIFLDHLGEVVHLCLELKNKINGINKAKIKKLVEYLKEGPTKIFVENITEQILDFIELRNQEKKKGKKVIYWKAIYSEL